MKIKNVVRDYDEVMAMEVPKHFKPKKPNIFWQTLTKVISQPALWQTHFTHREVGMEKLALDEPALILMNHSSFLDFEIAFSMLYPRKFNTVATLDSFVGLDWVMRQIGCFPTRKFIADLHLIRDIKHCLTVNKASVLMFPEAAYSFDGTKTTLPSTVAKLIKMLGVPFVMLETYGSYLRDPIFNRLQNRDLPVSAELRYVLSPEQIKEMSVEEIQAVIDEQFSFDQYRWQKENKIVIDEPFRADGLETVLYKCPHCQKEGKMEGKGIHLTCHECGKKWELTELGYLKALDGEDIFDHIPDWYRWERECIRKEILDGTYGFDVPCDIYMIVNTKDVYRVGEGRVSHNKEGLHLVGCEGKIDYSQSSKSMYTCEAAFHWYTLGDVIGMGNNRALYFAMPKEDVHVVGKVRLASEEIFKILEEEKTAKKLAKEAVAENKAE
jgi:1-acyl-sn-glycerol-3-phosphate acyltransferase